MLAIVAWGCGEDHTSSSTKFVDIEAGGNDNCAVRQDGTAVCWGEDFANPSEIAGPVDQFAVGNHQACFLRGTSVECVGPVLAFPNPILDVPPGDYIGVSSGLNTACAILTSGSVQCWGNTSTPFAPALSSVVALRQVGDDVCAVTAGQDAFCWAPDLTDYPVRHLPAGSYAEALPNNDWARCGLTTVGDIACDIGNCMPGDSSTAPCSDSDDWAGRVGTGPTGPFRHLTAGPRFFMCALRPNDDFVCWGDEYEVSTPGLAVPLKALEPTGTRFLDLSVGLHHVCGITVEGEVLCWGDDTYGQVEPPREVTVVDGG